MPDSASARNPSPRTPSASTSAAACGPRIRASRSRRCPLCGHHESCSWEPDGVNFCRRVQGPRPGYLYLGQAARDPQWAVYQPITLASLEQLCPLCSCDGPCFWTNDGLHFCDRRYPPEHKVKGWRGAGYDRKLRMGRWRRQDDQRGSSTSRHRQPSTDLPDPLSSPSIAGDTLAPIGETQSVPSSAPATDFGPLAEELHAAALVTGKLAELAANLGVRADALASLGAGYKCERRTLAATITRADGSVRRKERVVEDVEWSFPERNASGAVIGIKRRLEGGNKLYVPGSKAGLTFANNWAASDGPVFLVEGASDTAAALTIGLAAVGRPSNTGGVELLAELLRDWPAERPVVVVGERDRKKDGRWPGREGAVESAHKLADALGRPVLVALPPGEAKDTRAWLNGQRPDLDDVAGLAQLGQRFVQAVMAEAETVQPRPGRPGRQGELFAAKPYGPVATVAATAQPAAPQLAPAAVTPQSAAQAQAEAELGAVTHQPPTGAAPSPAVMAPAGCPSQADIDNAASWPPEEEPESTAPPSVVAGPAAQNEKLAAHSTAEPQPVEGGVTVSLLVNTDRGETARPLKTKCNAPPVTAPRSPFANKKAPCPRRQGVVLQHRSVSRRLMAGVARCKSWSCPGCFDFLRNRAWAVLRNRLAALGQQPAHVWRGASPWSAVRQRLHRASNQLGPDDLVEYARIKAGGGNLVVATFPFSGSAPMPASEAAARILDALVALVCTPDQASQRVRPVTTSQGWQPDETTGQYRRLDRTRDLDQTAEILARNGCDVEPGAPRDTSAWLCTRHAVAPQQMTEDDVARLARWAAWGIDLQIPDGQPVPDPVLTAHDLLTAPLDDQPSPYVQALEAEERAQIAAERQAQMEAQIRKEAAAAPPADHQRTFGFTPTLKAVQDKDCRWRVVEVDLDGTVVRASKVFENELEAQAAARAAKKLRLYPAGLGAKPLPHRKGRGRGRDDSGLPGAWAA